MKKSYEKPVIVKLESGLMNKFGASQMYTRRVRTEIEGVTVNELVDHYGSPLFVFSERRLRERYHNLYQAFATRYPQVVFGWSYKTNYLQAICAIMHQEGALAEVVSEFEYDKARKLGVPGANIIFNGPYKPKAALEKAVAEGAKIHIDHADELHDLEQIAQSLDHPLRVGLRLNMDTGIHPQWSRFGFNLDSGEAMDMVKRLAHSGKLVLNGLHCHIGTFILEPSAYAKQSEKMVTFAYEVEDAFGFKMDYFDIGGGLPSRSKLKGAYLPPDVGIPPMEEYAEAITGALYRNLRPGDQPQLILENGRALVDESGLLVTSIIARKRLPDGRRAYVIDAGVNDLFTSFWYRYNLEIDREVHGMNEPSVVYGPLCMNIDVMDEGTLLPLLQRGTRLIVSPVGAYNVTQWMQFIHYRPNVVLINTEGQVECIREGEDLSDIERRERLPERLKLI